MTVKTIDIHAHVLTEETMRLLRSEAPSVGPRLERIDDEAAVLEVAGKRYRPFPRGAFDLERRFADMAAGAVDVQVVSVTPQTLLYDQEAALAAACAGIQNDQIAKLIRQYPDQFWGLATLPMQAPQLAADELGR